jgi:endonuclease-3
MPAVNWSKAIKPLLAKYKGQKHPLDYKNIYQLIVMVILSARDSDRHINQVAPKLFAAYPNMKAMSKATLEDLAPYLKGVINSGTKASWILGIAKEIKDNRNIPRTLDGLTALNGIGRKSANVILREAGEPPEGVMVDLHVQRVAPRLGIATGTNPKKIEEQIMEQLPQKEWEAGMAMSFLGREICRPKPKCELCLMRPICQYYKTVISKL